MVLFRTGLYVKNHSVEKVQVAKTPIASYNGNVTGLYIPELIAYITAKQSGSGTPAPDNIRPISGWSECNVVRCGKNLFNYDLVTPYNAQVIITRNDGVITIQNNNAYQLNALHGNSFFLSSGSYTVSIEESISVSITVNKGGTYYSRAIASGDTSGVITISEDGVYDLTCNISGNSTLTIKRLQIELGSTVTAYEAYTGNTYTIQLGDTYYGCYINATTGLLTVTDVSVDMGSLEWSRKHTSTTYYYFVATPDPFKADNFNFISSVYNNVNQIRTRLNDKEMGVFNTASTETYRQIVVRDDAYETAEAFIASVTGQQLVYELANPITVQLTPTQIEQLLGANNVWADTGDVEGKFYNVVR